MIFTFVQHRGFKFSDLNTEIFCFVKVWICVATLNLMNTTGCVVQTRLNTERVRSKIRVIHLYKQWRRWPDQNGMRGLLIRFGNRLAFPSCKSWRRSHWVANKRHCRTVMAQRASVCLDCGQTRRRRYATNNKTNCPSRRRCRAARSGRAEHADDVQRSASWSTPQRYITRPFSRRHRSHCSRR